MNAACCRCCRSCCACPRVRRPKSRSAPAREDWVLKSHVAFLEADGKTPRDAPTESLRLWVPYVVGDLYGAPNAGELAPVTFKPDLSFVLDLNKSHENLAKVLIPTEFSQKWMIIEPADGACRAVVAIRAADGWHRAGRCSRVVRRRHRHQAHARLPGSTGAPARRDRPRGPKPAI